MVQSAYLFLFGYPIYSNTSFFVGQIGIHKHTLTKSLRLVLSQELVQFVVYGSGALTMLVRSSPMLASVLGLTLIASVVTMGRFWGSCTIMATPASSDWPLLIHCEWKSQTHDWICEFSKLNYLKSYQPSQGLKCQQFMNQNRKLNDSSVHYPEVMLGFNVKFQGQAIKLTW